MKLLGNSKSMEGGLNEKSNIEMGWSRVYFITMEGGLKKFSDPSPPLSSKLEQPLAKTQV